MIQKHIFWGQLRMNKLSIIIPIYNGARFISKCLDGIIEQDNGLIEIILIDDGSIDESANICRKYAEENAWIKYFFKENGGVSSARNLGIEKATGDYVWFVDIDDQIANGAIQAIFSASTAELLVYDFNIIDDDTEKRVQLNNRDDYISLEDKNFFFKNFVFTYKLNNALWNKVFDLSIIKQYALRFNESIKIGEDFLFSLSYYRIIKHIRFYPQTVYCYYIHAGGAMKSKNTTVFSYQQEIAMTVKTLYSDDLDITIMQQFLLMQLVCGVNQSKERGVDKKVLKQYIKSYMQDIMEGQHFSRQVVNNFLNSERAAFLSKIKFKLRYFKYYK